MPRFKVFAKISIETPILEVEADDDTDACNEAMWHLEQMSADPFMELAQDLAGWPLEEIRGSIKMGGVCEIMDDKTEI